MSNPLQLCPCCKTHKTFEEFNKGSRPNGLSSYCKECCYLKHVCKTYNISQAAYCLLVERANGLCEMCGKEPNRLVVDHDHDTGAVRGLICDRCNLFLGLLDTNPNIFNRAESYLARYIARQ